MKFLIIFGTRPEAIKMAPVIHELRESSEVIVCVTAQHREMLDQVLDLFNLEPDYDLNLMKKKQNLYQITSDVILSLRRIVDIEKPDVVFVHGDTTTSMVAALAAFYAEIPVAHVEAGLRTYDIYSPFPEEVNRQITSRISTFHFAPTESAKQNLINEQVPKENIHVTGNTVVDALLSKIEKARRFSLPEDLLNRLKFLEKPEDEKIILVTGHRRESFGPAFEEICHALLELAKSDEQIKIIYPVHLNPNVIEPVNRILSDQENIFLIEPLEYLAFLKIMDLSSLIMTDSGGIQEEAPSLGIPVLVMRNKTERPEGIISGLIKLVGTEKKEIINAALKELKHVGSQKNSSPTNNPYGDGKASKRIRKIIEKSVL